MEGVETNDERGLFDHARDQIKAVFHCRGAVLERIALIRFGDLVGAKALGRIERMGQRRDAFGVQALELVDHVQNAAKIVDEAAGLVVANGESGQVCGPAHMRFFKRHDRGFLAIVMEHISL